MKSKSLICLVKVAGNSLGSTSKIAKSVSHMTGREKLPKQIRRCNQIAFDSMSRRATIGHVGWLRVPQSFAIYASLGASCINNTWDFPSLATTTSYRSLQGDSKRLSRSVGSAWYLQILDGHLHALGGIRMSTFH